MASEERTGREEDASTHTHTHERASERKRGHETGRTSERARGRERGQEETGRTSASHPTGCHTHACLASERRRISALGISALTNVAPVNRVTGSISARQYATSVMARSTSTRPENKKKEVALLTVKRRYGSLTSLSECLLLWCSSIACY